MEDRPDATPSPHAGDGPAATGTPGPLPDPVEAALYDDAQGVDELLDRIRPDDGPVLQAVAKLNGRALLKTETRLHPPISIAWPPWLFIPGAANWKNYWILPPPDAQRYALEWVEPGPVIPGARFASAANGQLAAYQAIVPTDRTVHSDAAIGIFYKPAPTLSVVSLEPTVTCSGVHRWRNLLEGPLIAGSTWVRIRLILAWWEVLPVGTFDFINWREVPVVDTFPQSGLGAFPITPFARSFSGQDLATPILVQGGRTYLFAVIARVWIQSTLTDSSGNPLPPNLKGAFNVWGTLTCAVPEIDVFEKTVYIP